VSLCTTPPANSDELGCGQKKRNKTVKSIALRSRIVILSAGKVGADTPLKARHYVRGGATQPHNLQG
jgi:hypothetical protein